MNAVGIDVSKGKSMVTILRPFGEIVSSPFEIKHTSSDILSLIKLIHSIEGESRIVMEHTGHYYEVLAQQFSAAGLFVSAVNPKLVKNFNNDSLRKVKSDKADSIKIARYALDKWQNLKPYSIVDELRTQLKAMNRLKAFVKGVRGYFSYYLRRFSLCFCLNNAFQPVLSSQTTTMVKKYFDFIICFALLNHKNSIRFVFLRMVIWGG